MRKSETAKAFLLEVCRQNLKWTEIAVCFEVNAEWMMKILLLKVYSTVTDFARLRGLSTSVPRASAV